MMRGRGWKGHGMSEATAREQVVDMVTYLRETITKIDDVMAEWQQRRLEVSTRLAALEAANDPGLQTIADDYADRVRTNTPYENARPAEDVITEAHRRHTR